jgi:8-oxo-dGTP pyrophosphatase MutT (NUDIX family)
MNLRRIEAQLEAHTAGTYSGLRKLVPSAVLVPLMRTPLGIEVLFTLRRDDLGTHPGQVSFPGGRIDPEDNDSWSAALRECHEELGINATSIRQLGQLSDFPVVTNFLITPWVAECTDLGPYETSQREVAEVFKVPLAVLQDKAQQRTALFSRFDKEERVHFFHGGPHVIWGATAAILAELLDVIATQ